MSMKAQIHTDSSGNIIIHMEGGLNYDNTSPLRNELNQLTEQNPQSTITLDLNKLDFVGSSGISHFVETIEILNKRRDQIRLSGVSDEFMKIFKLYNMKAMDAIIESFENDETESLGSMFAGRKNTFQN